MFSRAGFGDFWDLIRKSNSGQEQPFAGGSTISLPGSSQHLTYFDPQRPAPCWHCSPPPPPWQLELLLQRPLPQAQAPRARAGRSLWAREAHTSLVVGRPKQSCLIWGFQKHILCGFFPSAVFLVNWNECTCVFPVAYEHISSIVDCCLKLIVSMIQNNRLSELNGYIMIMNHDHEWLWTTLRSMDNRTIENICTDVLVTWRTILIRPKEINLNMPLEISSQHIAWINLNMPLEISSHHIAWMVTTNLNMPLPSLSGL